LNPKNLANALFDFEEITHFPIYTNPTGNFLPRKGNNLSPIAILEARKV
jgi:hypothetical protein